MDRDRTGTKVERSPPNIYSLYQCEDPQLERIDSSASLVNSDLHLVVAREYEALDFAQMFEWYSTDGSSRVDGRSVAVRIRSWLEDSQSFGIVVSLNLSSQAPVDEVVSFKRSSSCLSRLGTPSNVQEGSPFLVLATNTFQSGIVASPSSQLVGAVRRKRSLGCN